MSRWRWLRAEIADGPGTFLVRVWPPTRLLALPAYLLIVLALTWPLARDFGRALPTVLGHVDSLLQAYILGWDWRALATHPLGVFDAPIFHPERRTLTYMDHLLGEAVLGAPVFTLTGNHAAGYNFVFLLGFVLSAWTMYRLVRWLGVSRPGSFLCGYLFAMSPYRLCNLVDLNLLQTQFLPLGMLFGLRFARERRSRDLWGATLTLAVQAYFAWYYVFLLATIYATVLAHALAVRRIGWRDLITPRTAAALLVAALLILPVAYPYWMERAAAPDFRRTIHQSTLYAADPFDYLRVNVFNRTRGFIGPLSGDLAYWPGLVTIVLATLGIVAWRRMPGRGGEAGIAALVALVGFVLSLGPFLRLAGHQTAIQLPFVLLFRHVPGFDAIRAPGRYAVVVLLGGVMLAGLGYEHARRRLAYRGRRATAALAVVSLVLGVVDSYSVPVPMVPFPDLRHPPAVYRWLREWPRDGAVLELPCPAYEKDERMVDAVRQLYTHVHRRPRLDGVSGFVPVATRELRLAVQEFPGARALEAAARSGARLIVMHYGDLAPGARQTLRARAAREPRLRTLAAFGDDVVYELRGSE